MDFQYKARTADGAVKTGKIDASNEFEAMSKLQNMGMYVINLSAQGGGAKSKIQSIDQSKVESKHKKLKRSRGLKNDDIILFCDQMSVLLNAGVDIIRSLEILLLQVSSQKLYDIIVDLKNQVSGGASLSTAMTKYPRVFEPYMINLVEIGESSGTLADVMLKIGEHLEASEAIKRKIKSALTYPAVLILVSMVAILVFMVKIIPMFERIFGDFDITLPKLTQWVVLISRQVRQNFIFIVVFIVALFFISKKLLSKHDIRVQFDRIILRLPVLGNLLLRSAVVNFCSSFSVLLSNGVSMVEAMDMVSGSLGNFYLGERFLRIKEKVKGGVSVSQGMEESGEFPPLVVQMIAVGEETGKLTEMLEKVSQFYSKRVSAALDAMTSIFEPLILVVMGSVIGVLVISMFLPIFKLSQIGSGGM